MKTILVFGASYRCGSTLVQRVLNTMENVLILGEENSVFKLFAKEIYDRNRTTSIEGGCTAQEEAFFKGEDIWQANIGWNVLSHHYAGRCYFDAYFKINWDRLRGSNKEAKVFGLKTLFPTPYMAMYASLFFENPYILFLSRPLVESYESYMKCPWSDNRRMDFNTFSNMWLQSNVLQSKEYCGLISDYVKFDELHDLAWLDVLCDKCELSYDKEKVQKVLDTKLVDRKSYERQEVPEYEKQLIKELSR